MWPPPPLEATVTIRPRLDLIMPQATKPSVVNVPIWVIVGTSTMAIPLGRNETYARSPSSRKTEQIGALPSEAKERLPITCQDCAASSAAILIRLIDAIWATRSTDPSGDGLAWCVSVGPRC